MEIPTSYILGAIGTLAATIATMGRVIWSSMQRRERELGERIKEQGKTLKEQGKTIDALQADIKRLSGGCGLETCLWRARRG